MKNNKNDAVNFVGWIERFEGPHSFCAATSIPEDALERLDRTANLVFGMVPKKKPDKV